MTDRDDKPVGYRNPPKHTRWKRGQSGNPRGRPKGSKNTKTLLREVLDANVTVNAPEGPRTVPMRKAILLGQAAKAAKGDPRAAALILGLEERFDAEDSTLDAERPLSSTDTEILEAFLKQKRGHDDD